MESNRPFGSATTATTSPAGVATAPPGTGQGGAGVTQLDFNQAMLDFKIMFPDMPEDIIEAVLRSNQGVVDATIDELLRINTQSEPQQAQVHSTSNANNGSNLYNVNAHSGGVSSGKSYSKSFLLNKSSHKNDKISKDSLRYRHNWNPPLLGELPVNFLRISLNETQRKLTNAESGQHHHHHHQHLHHHGSSASSNSASSTSETALLNATMLQQKMEENERNRQAATGHDDPEVAQFLADERFAILLQNEEFVRELQLNQDFMSSLGDVGIPSRPGTAEGPSHGSSGASGSSNLMSHDDAAFKERLRNMSKVSKRKFAQLARLFSGKSKKNFQHQQLNDGSDYPYCEDFTNENYEEFRSRGRIN